MLHQILSSKEVKAGLKLLAQPSLLLIQPFKILERNLEFVRILELLGKEYLVELLGKEYLVVLEPCTTFIEFILLFNNATKLEGVDIIEWDATSGQMFALRAYP